MKASLYLGYHIERSVIINQTIKFNFVRSSNEINLTKNKCKLNQMFMMNKNLGLVSTLFK